MCEGIELPHPVTKLFSAAKILIKPQFPAQQPCTHPETFSELKNPTSSDPEEPHISFFVIPSQFFL